MRDSDPSPTSFAGLLCWPELNSQCGNLLKNEINSKKAGEEKSQVRRQGRHCSPQPSPTGAQNRPGWRPKEEDRPSRGWKLPWKTEARPRVLSEFSFRADAARRVKVSRDGLQEPSSQDSPGSPRTGGRGCWLAVADHCTRCFL